MKSRDSAGSKADLNWRPGLRPDCTPDLTEKRNASVSVEFVLLGDLGYVNALASLITPYQ